jgi:uncharacterized RDD family membrane protein YckC
LYIARRARPVTTPAPLPPELQQAIDHPLAAVRAGVVQELARLLQSRHAGLALAARLTLERLTEDDSRRVSAAATAALAAQPEPPQPLPPQPLSPEPPLPEPPLPEPLPRLDLSATVVDFAPIPQHSKPPERRVRLGNAGGGTLNARASTEASWLELRQVGDELVITVDTTTAGEHDGVITIGSDGGLGIIRVTGTVEPHPTPAPQPPAVAVTQPPTAGLTSTGHVQQPRSSPAPQPEHATRGRRQRRQRGSPELGGDSHDYYQGKKLATWWQRMGAGLIDLLSMLVPYVLLAQIAAGLGVLAWLVIWLYNGCYLNGTTGQSWGKRVLHLKLVRMADNQLIGAGAAAVRGLAHILDILTLGVGFLLPLWDARRQTLADKVMKTIVVSQGKTGAGVSQTS